MVIFGKLSKISFQLSGLAFNIVFNRINPKFKLLF